MNRFAIRAFVGPNGGGKTLAAVEQVAIPAWERGRKVVANLHLYPEVLGFDPALFQPLSSFLDLFTIANCELIIDEISSAFPSRQAQAMPAQVLRQLNQLRKIDVRCTWTGPAWDRADKALREVTKAVTYCEGSYPDRFVRDVPLGGAWFPPAVKDENGGRLEVTDGWLPNRLFMWRTYDSTQMDEFTLAQSKKLKPLSVRRHWRTRHRGMHAYSTLEQVMMLDHLDDVGACMTCGGQRTRPKCSCGPRAPEGATAPVGALPLVTSNGAGVRLR